MFNNYSICHNRYSLEISHLPICSFINLSLIKRGHLLPNKLCSRFLLIFLPFVLYQCTFYLSIRTLWLHRRKWLWTHFLPMNPVFLSLREVFGAQRYKKTCKNAPKNRELLCSDIGFVLYINAIVLQITA